jgi:hypothetical protein
MPKTFKLKSHVPEGMLVISNLGPDDETFDNDFGTWNVGRAQRDCDAGNHGHPWVLVTDEAHAGNKSVEVEEEKVLRFMKSPEILEKPLIAVMEDGKAWLIEGHHRLRALHRLRVPAFRCFVIEEENAPRYMVLFNAERIAPWKR